MKKLSGETLRFLIKISCLDFKNPICIQELIKKINISRGNFTFIKRILKENNIIIEIPSNGNALLLNINKRKLDIFIKESDFYNMIANYIINKDPLLHQP